MGRDEEVMPYISSANIAGGYHGGDPHVMRETVALAADHDVGVGVHPGLPDKMGFGRRKMDATPEEVRDYVTYQLGALNAFCDQHGVTFQHVKPHGAMYSMLSDSPEHARAVMEGILDVDDDLIYLATDRNIYEVTQEYDDLDAVFEGYVDLDYNPDRSLIVEQEKGDPRPRRGRRPVRQHRDRGPGRSSQRRAARHARGQHLHPRRHAERRRDPRGHPRPHRGTRHRTHAAAPDRLRRRDGSSYHSSVFGPQQNVRVARAVTLPRRHSSASGEPEP